jgi:hypothetical protein
VLVVRPQPGQLVTWGMKLRMESDCRICCAACTSSVRSPPGLGVRLTRMVSPMPASSSGARPAVEAMRPFDAHAGFGEAEVQGVVAAAASIGVDVDEVADAGDFGGEDDLVVAEAVALGGFGGLEGADDHGFHHDVARGQRDRRAWCSRPSCG